MFKQSETSKYIINDCDGTEHRVLLLTIPQDIIQVIIAMSCSVTRAIVNHDQSTLPVV